MEFHKASAPEPSRTSQGICTGTLLSRNLTKHLLRQNPPEPHKVSAPEPSGTSQGICPGTLRNLTTHLHLDPPEPPQVAAPETSGTSPGTCTKTLYIEPNQVSAPETSGTSPSTCTGNFRNLTEPSGASAGIFTGTLRRYLHQNPPQPCPEPGVEAAQDRTGANLG